MNVKNFVKRVVRYLKNEKTSKQKLLEQMPKNSVCAEIGVWKGGFSKEIVQYLQPQKLHLIDPWKYQTSFGKRLYGGKVAQNQNDMDGIFEAVKRQFIKHPEVVFHRNFSEEIAADFSDEYFDWVYVDGNHYFEYVMKDLEMYLPKIKKGGFLTGDDYLWTSPELNGDLPVKRAVKQFLEKNSSLELVAIIGSQFILQKN